MKLWTLFCLPLIYFTAFHQSAEPQTADKQLNQYSYQQSIIKKVSTDKKWIALTFDDGPDLVETPKLLDVLRQYNAKATFFVIGKQGEKLPHILRREVSEGHELANHSFNHRDLRGLTVAGIDREISKAEEEIFSITGQHTKFFRPPGGFYTNKIVETAQRAGYTVIMWTWYQDSKDWRRPGVEKIVNRVISNAHPGDIVLLHDRITGRSQTIEALAKILPELQKQGYEFVTISQLLGSMRTKE